MADQNENDPVVSEPIPTLDAPVIVYYPASADELEGYMPTENDGAPKGYAYRLLLQDHPVLGCRGKVVTIKKSSASGYTAEQMRAPTAEEKQIGLLGG